MIVTITISHSYTHEGYYLPEKKVTGHNSYREYKKVSNALSSFKKMYDNYKNYLKDHKEETIVIKYSTVMFQYKITEIYIMYYDSGEFKCQTLKI